MKLLILTAFSSLFSLAATPVYVNQVVNDPRVGEIRLTVKDPGHVAPLAVRIVVKCKGQRKFVDVEDRAICRWGGFGYDTESGVMVYKIGLLSEEIADDSCIDQNPAQINFHDVCRAGKR